MMTKKEYNQVMNSNLVAEHNGMSEEMHVVDFLNDLGTAINFYGTIDNGVVIDSGNLITSSYELKKYISDFLEDVAEDMAFDVLKFV